MTMACKTIAESGGYQKYVNFDGIGVPLVKAIPSDYDGAMGVPISFLDKYNPEQFEILGYSLFIATPIKQVATQHETYQPGGNSFYLRDKDNPNKLNRLYGRVAIKHRR